MRKSLIITIAAALLLAAVLCTAGCVDAPSDPIVGTYVTGTDDSVSYAVFENGGSGHITATAKTDGAAAAGAVIFTWTKNADGTYTAELSDGTSITAVLEAKRGLLTIGDVVYEKQASALSGTTPDGLIRNQS